MEEGLIVKHERSQQELVFEPSKSPVEEMNAHKEPVAEKDSVKEDVADQNSVPNLQRTKCEVFSRVVGYIRPVQQWNDGKSAEFGDRTTFKVGCSHTQ